MFEWVDKHKRWIQIILLILIVPSFAFFGINYYFQERGTSGAVAKVAGSKISPQEFEEALRERQDQLRQAMQDKADPAMLDSNEVRNSVINGLVDKRALLAHAMHAGVAVTDVQVRRIVTGISAFRDESTGKFSQERYTQLLRAQGMSPVIFEERVRQDLRMSQVRDTVANSALVPGTVVDRLGRIREQQREVNQWLLTPDQVRGRVKVTDEEVKQFYEAHKNEFRVPERVRVEYLMLTLESVTKGIEIAPQEIDDWYKSHQAQYEKAEERKASHILIAVAKDAKPEDKAAARRKAEDLLAQVRKAPKSFGELASKNSQDPGSAGSGGDLGFFARGVMVKPFDDALFAMKAAGDVEGPVETQYGFHVIRLDAIKPGEKTPLEKIRAEITEELKKGKAGKSFADAAETMQNRVYEQSDSLKPASDALKLPVQTSDWITRDGGGHPLLVKPNLLNKLFSDDAIKGKHNTDAVEVATNTMVAARVIDHKAADVLPFDTVRKDVEQQLLLERATKLVEEEGKATLARLKSGDDKGVDWAAPVTVSLQKPAGLQQEAAREVFSADPAKLPVYVGIPVSKGRFVIYRIGKVIEAPPLDAEQRKALGRQLSQIAAQQQFDAYMQTVKAGAGVEIDASKVEKKLPQ